MKTPRACIRGTIGCRGGRRFLSIRAGGVLGVLLALSFLPSISRAQSDSARVAHLFLVASSGEVRFRAMVEPARDSLIAMGAKAAAWLVRKLDATDARERHTLAGLFRDIGAVAVPYVVPYLDSSGEYRPKNAARCLGMIGDSSATLPLIAQIGNPIYAVRSQVATALGRIGDVRAVEPLLQQLSHESDSDVRKSCVVALGSIGDTTAVPVLIRFLGDSFFGVRQSAVTALGRIDPPPINALLVAIHRFRGVARHCAIVALGGCDTDRARTFLLDMLRSPDALVRGFAIEGLSRHPTDSIRELVTGLRAREDDPFVLAEIARLEDTK